MKANLRLAALALAIMLFIWVADSLVDAAFHPEETTAELLFQPTNYEVYMRLVTGLALGLSTIFFRVTLRRNQRIQKDLAQQKEIYQTLVESNPDFIIVHRDYRVQFVNPNTLEYFGLDELGVYVGTSILDFILPDFHAQIRQANEKVLAEPGTVRLELSLRTRADKIRDIETFSSRLSWKGETAVFTFFRDITEAVENRRNLIASRERLQLALDAARDGVWDWDIRSGKVVYSKSWAEMLGYPLEEVSGDLGAWRRLIHPDDHKRAQSLLDSHLLGQVPGYEIEVRLRHKDGQYIWVLDRGRVVEWDSEGKPLRMTGTHREITARKEAELALEIRKQVAEAFLTGSGGDVFGKSLEVICQAMEAPVGLFTTFSTQSRLIVAATRPEMSGQNSMKSVLSFDRNNLPEVFARVIDENRCVIRNEPLDLPGHMVDLEALLGVPISSRDQVLGAIYVANKAGGFHPKDRFFLESLAGYVAPILQSHLNSEAKEAQLRQAQKMEALGALAGGIAHDFNNILQAIMGFSTLALEDPSAKGNITRDLERVLKATRRGQDLVKRILLFSRRDEQRHGPIPIQDVVSEAINLIKPSIPATIEVRSRLDAEGALVFGDPGQVSQIILNLATNAYHAMEPDGGILEIDLQTAHSATIDLELPEGLWDQEIMVLTVSDTGGGMSSQVMSRIFDPFFTTKGVGQGTGLGMSVVHGIVKAHRGDIRIDSELEIGTTVTVFLPLFTGTAGAFDEEKEISWLSGKTTGKHIVLVDDELDITDLGQALLEKLGHQVTVENNGRNLLKRLEADPGFCDLVITDLIMPQITGMKLAERLAVIKPDLPVILITGMSEQKGIDFSNHSNIFGLIRKPFSGDTLRRKVDQVLSDPGAREEA